MSDVLLIAVLVAFFLLAIGLVRVLGRMIDREAGGAGPAGADGAHDTHGGAGPDGADDTHGAHGAHGADPLRTGRPR